MGQYLIQNRGFETNWLVMFRLFVSGIVLLSIAYAKTGNAILNICKDRTDAKQLLVFALIGMMPVQYTFFAAIAHSNVATATILQFTGPVMIAVYLAISQRKLPRFLDVLAILFAVVGTTLLITHGDFGKLAISNAALFWGLMSAVAMAFYSIYPGELLRKYYAVTVVGWSMLLGGGSLMLIHAPWKVAGSWDWVTILYLVFIVLIGSVFAFYAYLSATKLIGPQKSSLLISGEPLTAALISVFLLGGKFVWIDYIGTLLVLSTIFLLTYRKKRSEA
jgi:drug/metabolite transporter (DMT)-like permease